MELVSITQTKIGSENTNAVNARDLHEALKVKKDFSDWIKQQLMIGRKNSVYVEGIDYLKNHLKGVRTIEYILSLDTAKRLSMLSKTKKGNEVRKYFIEAEKQNTQALMSPNQITEALALTAQSLTLQDERLDTQHERIQEVEVEMEEVKLYIQEDIQNRPIGHTQQTALLNARHKKVFQILESYGKDKDDKELKRKIYAKVGSQFKKQFDLPRYDSLPNVKFNKGLEFINNLSLKDMT